MRSRLPSKVHLPGGYRITIQVAPRPSKVGLNALEQDEDAAWHSGDRSIVVWEGLTPRQKWLKLAHEFTHVMHDYELWVRQQVGAE